jgi:hypothetical protein
VGLCGGGVDADAEQQCASDGDLLDVDQHRRVPVERGEQAGGHAGMVRAADGQQQAWHGITV